MWTNDLWVVGLTGAAIGGVIGWPLLRRPAVTSGGTTLATRPLGALLLLGGAAVGLIAINHSGLVGSAARDAGLVAVPLLGYLAGSIYRGGPPDFVWLLPAGTLASTYVAVLWMRTPFPSSSAADGSLVARMIVFAVAMNAAQAIRTFWPHVGLFREIVPITMTAGFLSIATLAMRQLLAGLDDAGPAAAPRYAKSGVATRDAERLLETLDRRMRDDRWYRDPHLSLIALAAKAGVRPHVLSQSLNQIDGRTLNSYLAGWRVAEAKRLLTDPAFDRYTIDALAEAAGFASRSAFYKVFKAHEGITPTAFRARARALPEE
jgi:AraC-like DNA-binding protein